MANKPNLQSGLTIIEFLIAVTILGIITSLAVPAFVNMGETFGVDGKQRNLISAIKFARTEAAKQNLPVSVCVASGTTANSCSTINADSWNDGWHVFLDNDGDGVIDPAVSATDPDDTILRTQPAIPSVSVATTPANTNTLTFLGSGDLAVGGGVSFRVCDQDTSNLDCTGDAYTNGFDSLLSGQIVSRPPSN